MGVASETSRAMRYLVDEARGPSRRARVRATYGPARGGAMRDDCRAWRIVAPMKYSKTSSRNRSAVASRMKAPLETPIPPAFRLNARSAGRFFGLDQRADQDRGEYS